MGAKKRKELFEDEINLNNAELPFASLSNNAHIELFGNTRMLIEGKYLITEYSEELIKIKLLKQSLLVFGSAIMLCSVEKSSLMISGKFSRFEFE